MLTIILTAIFLSLFGHNLPPYATYAALFMACLYAWLGSGLPIWTVTVCAVACWCMVEAVIVRVTSREFSLLWQVGNVRFAVAMVGA